jgi:type 1 glutamine amidotransferase
MTHRCTRRHFAAAGCALVAPALRAENPPPEPVRVLVVTGGHDHEPSFYSVFERQNGMDVNVDPHPGAFRSDRTQRYDVVVLYDMLQVDEIEESRRKNLQRFVEAGKGLVILHHAVCSYNSWTWWWQEVAGVRYLPKPEGDRPASTYKHDEKLRVAPVGSHPVLRGIGAMEMMDEAYKGMWMSPHNTVLLKTDNPTSDGPVAWVSAYPKSRVVVIQLGHGGDAHRHVGYWRLVRNAVIWSAGA